MSTACGESEKQVYTQTQETGRDDLTLPVFHKNVGRQQTLNSKPFLMLCALPVSLSMSLTSVCASIKYFNVSINDKSLNQYV